MAQTAGTTDGVSATSARAFDATLSTVAAAAVIPAQLLSRRAIRERMLAEAAKIAAEQPESAVGGSALVADDVPAASALVVDDLPAASAPAVDDLPAASAPAVDDLPSAPADTTASADAPAGDIADAFERASRLFQSTASEGAGAPVAEPLVAETAAPDAASVHVAPRRRIRRFITIGASLGAMSLAGLIAVSMTLPTAAVAAGQGGRAAALTSLVAASGGSDKKAADEEIQAFVTSSDVQNESLVRADSFSTVSLVQVAAEQGINYSGDVFVNDPDAAIQWPFLVGVGMTYGYGMRSGTLHEGIDFVPGNGAPVQAIADGVVRIATEQGGAYGVTVYIDHVIDGQTITSHYAHMQYGSLQVAEGQTVKVGTVIGKTGNTGRSYGAHMHFELIVNGATIDPLPWLQANAGRDSY